MIVDAFGAIVDALIARMPKDRAPESDGRQRPGGPTVTDAGEWRGPARRAWVRRIDDGAERAMLADRAAEWRVRERRRAR